MADGVTGEAPKTNTAPPSGIARICGSRVCGELGKLTALLGWCLVVRAPTFLRSVIDSDESLYVLMADQWRQGHLPYLTVWDHKPPGVYWLFRMALDLFGHSMLSIRLLACMFVFAAAAFVYAIGCIATGDRTAAFMAGVAYPAFSILWRGTAANVEHFFIALDLAGVLILTVLHVRRPSGARRWWCVIGAGFCFGLALQLKYIAVFEIAFFFFVYAIREWRALDRGHRGQLLLELAAMVLAASGPTALAVAYFWTFGQVDEFLRANFWANLRHASPQPTAGRLIAGLLSWGRWLVESASLWITPVLLCFRRPRIFAASQASPVGSRGVAPALAVWVLVGLVEASSTWRFYAHYFLVTLPPLCLLAGEGWRLARSHEVIRSWFARPAVWTTALCAFPVTFISVLDYAAWVRERIAGEVDEPARVAAYLRDRLRPGAPIYVVDRRLGPMAR